MWEVIAEMEWAPPCGRGMGVIGDGWPANIGYQGDYWLTAALKGVLETIIEETHVVRIDVSNDFHRLFIVEGGIVPV